ncbi:hypothetical protein LMG27177_03772 [Paraburkholderia fynbosensis]|uniref:Uncharacterized protein n=1 Tax=Paraburkholderia fynbosensis TaxID=1200993 RepID=A0A6J5G9H5_9BURK|nr:hypothetical protein LMG27177_03772 [Paraburkholderia fynbosensis]
MIRTRAVSPTLGLRKRTIEDDDGRADSARHGTTAWHDGTANAMPDSLLLERK